MAVTHPVKSTDTDQNYYGQQKTTSEPLDKEVASSFKNSHANHMNAGNEMKKSRMQAMKRRISKSY